MLAVDFWRFKQWPITTEVASSPTENVAYISKSKQSTGIWYLFYWRFRIHTSKLTKLLCDTTYCAIHKTTNVVAFHLSWQQIVLTKSCFYHSNKISDKWWLRRIWLPHIMTWAHVWITTVYGNHIMTLRRKEPIVKIFRTKPESNIVHTLETWERK